MRTLGHLVTVTALCFSLGLHWFSLQSIAWTTMLLKYSQEFSLTEAVAKTFDGNHPCGLCRGVEKGRSSEKKTVVSSPGKLDLFCAPPAGKRVRDFRKIHFPRLAIFAPPRFDSPPTPPPRFA